MPFTKGHSGYWKDRKRGSLKLEQKLKISKSRIGQRIAENTKKKMSLSHVGKNKYPKSDEHKDKLSKKLLGNKNAPLGEKNHFWKGGITPINRRIRSSREYKIWRIAVFERDNYTCIWCGAKNCEEQKVVLNADHIKPFAYYPELRFAIDNGRTLCEPCHKTTDTYGSKCRP